jgi:hypothetical protein
MAKYKLLVEASQYSYKNVSTPELIDGGNGKTEVNFIFDDVNIKIEDN